MIIDPQKAFSHQMREEMRSFRKTLEYRDRLIEAAQGLAVLGLQSKRYVYDVDFREAVDKVLDLIRD